jgi:hypothetical protein
VVIPTAAEQAELSKWRRGENERVATAFVGRFLLAAPGQQQQRRR